LLFQWGPSASSCTAKLKCSAKSGVAIASSSFGFSLGEFRWAFCSLAMGECGFSSDNLMQGVSVGSDTGLAV